MSGTQVRLLPFYVPLLSCNDTDLVLYKSVDASMEMLTWTLRWASRFTRYPSTRLPPRSKTSRVLILRHPGVRQRGACLPRARARRTPQTLLAVGMGASRSSIEAQSDETGVVPGRT